MLKTRFDEVLRLFQFARELLSGRQGHVEMLPKLADVISTKTLAAVDVSTKTNAKNDVVTSISVTHLLPQQDAVS